MAINTKYSLTQNHNQGQVQFATGKVVFTADSITAADYIEIEVGFRPKKVTFINATDRIRVEAWEGMADDTCIKTAANGAVSLETTNKGITITDSGFLVSQNATLGVIAASKTCYFDAQG